jgi:catechol 2,3-dioxygenase-like lactoylglutathione lyase family enzyme
VLNSIAPFFIVDDLEPSLEFYRSKLGFSVLYKGDGEGQTANLWGMVGRDGVMLFLKAIAPEIHPQPNHSRHGFARWDAYINASDPDSLYQEYLATGVPIHRELADTSDGLRAFEIRDNSGYVLCFGRPLREG